MPHPCRYIAPLLASLLLCSPLMAANSSTTKDSKDKKASSSTAAKAGTASKTNAPPSKSTAAVSPGTSSQSSPKPATPQRPPQPPLNEIAKTAAKFGVKECLGRISQVTSFLVGPAQNGAVMFLDPDQADKHLQGLSMEIASDNAVSYVTTSFANGTKPGECSATYDSVSFWSNSCTELASKVFTAFKPTQSLHRQIIALEDGPLVRVFLMPAGLAGCIAIKKETIYP